MGKLMKKSLFNLTTSFFDRYDRLRPHGILDLFQEMAGSHADELNIGFHPLYEKGIIWVLARNKYRVIAQPKSKEVFVETWPLPSQRFDSTREYKITSPDNLLCVVGSSLWVLYDYQKKRILPSDSVEIKGDFLEERNYQEKFNKLVTYPIEECLKAGQYIVASSVLDHNGHMNNARYTELFLDVINLSNEEIIDELQVDYISQSYLGDVIDVYMKRDKKEIFVYGYIEQKLCFQVYGKIKE